MARSDAPAAGGDGRPDATPRVEDLPPNLRDAVGSERPIFLLHTERPAAFLVLAYLALGAFLLLAALMVGLFLLLPCEPPTCVDREGGHLATAAIILLFALGGLLVIGRARYLQALAGPWIVGTPTRLIHGSAIAHETLAWSRFLPHVRVVRRGGEGRVWLHLAPRDERRSKRLCIGGLRNADAVAAVCEARIPKGSKLGNTK